MSKSIWSILAIGAAGVILMALMMQHLAEAVVDRKRSPYAAAVEARMGSKLLGRVRIEKSWPPDAQDESGPFSFVVIADVISGANKRKLAEVAGQELWLGSMRAGERASGVSVSLFERDDRVAGETFEIPSPVKAR